MARNYIENLREEVERRMREKAEQGIYPSRPPLGYQNNKSEHTIEVDPSKAPSHAECLSCTRPETVLQVQRSIWHGQEQAPKTPNAVRVVDTAEPLSQLLRDYVPDKPDTYSPQRAEDHSNNVTSFGLYTPPARKLASMPFVDSEQRHCLERVYPKTSRGFGSVTQRSPPAGHRHQRTSRRHLVGKLYGL
jgi:hypothetical protein